MTSSEYKWTKVDEHSGVYSAIGFDDDDANRVSADGYQNLSSTAHDFFVAQHGDVVFEIEGNLVAEFVVDKFPLITDNQKVYEDKWVVHLDLDAKRSIGGCIGDRKLSPADLYVFQCFYLLSSHVVVHSLANWGLNPYAPHWWIRRMAVVTILYNNLGFTGARLVYDNAREYIPGAMPFPTQGAWEPAGSPLPGPGYEDDHASPGDALQEVFRQNVKHGLSKHGQIRQLMPYSKIVDFIVKVRNFFLNQFEEYRSEFPAIDAEGMFAGTIIHGIDHANLYDVSSMRAPGREQSIRSDTGDFRLMEEIARITIAGLVSDLPGIGFAHQYRDSPHPFYQKVYAFAKKINKTYADRMDACIIK